MKTYFRLLSFAKPLGKFAIPYTLVTAVAILFNTLNFALLAPFLNTLFATDNCNTGVQQGGSGIMGMFNAFSTNAILEYGRWGALQRVVAIIVVCNIIANLFRYFSQWIMENLRVHTLLNLRKAVFFNVMDLHLGYFSNERKGDIISKIASDVQTVQFSVTGTLQVVFKEPVQLIAYLFMLFAISPTLTIYALLFIPVSGLIIGRIVKRLKQQAHESQRSFGMMISYLDEALSGIKIIKAFNAVDFIKAKFHDENKHYSSVTRSMAKRQQLASPVSEAMGVIMVSAIVLYGGYLIIHSDSQLQAADFITYIAIFSQVMRPAKAITDSFSNIHQGLAAGERVLQLIDEKPKIVDSTNAVAITSFEDSIEFKDVSFAYEDKPVLNNISLFIPKGKSVALVGPSGGGKSTLMDLLPRFIEPSSGDILIDGKSISALKTDSVRSLMGIINQESILFNDTIFNNIAFGKPEATAEEVEAAARIANAHEFILNTDKGYQTNIGDRGMKLSGGQKQRISIARSVLHNPEIMLMDEATSALDTESEKLVQDALNNLMKNRTSLIIAHRLSTIQNADKIVVLDNGTIVETGTHQELLAQNGLYKKLIDMQAFNE
ncbi:MAG: transporter ATP-binding protein [Sphingobacteriaceae bacterium]|jgi:subfamily B ATP-binding cassette protein MsbA|nr:transporter ATP-binding protein [Sphingobacteriaceae bacterium]